MIHDLVAPIDAITAREIGDVNVILNLASQSHVDRSISDPRPFVENNVMIALTMLDYARTLENLECFIQISTDEVYGSIESGSWTEEWPLLPNSPYSASKAGGELLARSYNKTHGLDVVITRCSNNY